MAINSSARIAIVGTGPAGLMAADVVAAAGVAVTVFEKRKAAGRKLLVAGSSGLNITNSLPLAEFRAHYSGDPRRWERTLAAFTPRDWMDFIERLGIKTFAGTSKRCFIEDMKAPRFLQAWLARLAGLGVRFVQGAECVGFAEGGELRFADGSRENFSAACFALGGGSWEPQETPLRWPAFFRERGVGFTAFTPSNVGYRVAWPEAFLREAEGQPLKSIVFTSSKGSRKGDAMVTAYGIEGTPVYFAGRRGPVTIDLKPDLDVATIIARLEAVRENLSPIRRVGKKLGLCPASFALVFHCTPPEIRDDLRALARRIKAFPLELGEPQPLTEAISSAGGVRFDELDENYMLLKYPGYFAAGEMLDWDTPTGGFLIQGSVSQGVCAGRGILAFLAKETK